jgi:SAM-dependent methyltransferase
MLLRKKDERGVRELEERIANARAGKRRTMPAPMTRAAAKVLHWAFGKAAGKAVSYALRNRSNKIFSQIEPFIEDGSTVLDLGCGNGKVGELISSRKSCHVALADVIDFNQTNLPFFKYGGRDLLFHDGEFEHVLLLTVLHHCDDPIKVMGEALRVADKSVIVIESVHFNRLHKELNRFLDWFVNHVLVNPDINLPFNFLTPTAWAALFERLGGKVVHMEHLGIDHPIVPEWHTLYVVEK